MFVRTALGAAICAGITAVMACQGVHLAQAADAADPLTAAVGQPPAAALSPRPNRRGAAGQLSEDAADTVAPPTAEQQAGSERPRLRGLGKQRYPREEPDVGFGGPSRTPDAAGDVSR